MDGHPDAPHIHHLVNPEALDRKLRVTLTFWNKWVPRRVEHLADGTTAVYFGFGRLSWRRD
jgi:hypothetical protein